MIVIEPILLHHRDLDRGSWAMKRKIAAILAADVVGYSRLVAEDENRALEHLLACREVFAEFVERGGGRIFNTAGDAVLAEFPSAVEALLAGIDIQDCLRTHYRDPPDGFRMQFRMGMTIGDVVERDGDLLGDGVNVAARLEGIAEPGGICISGVMYEQVLNKVSARFRDVGLKNVKNIPAPIHVYALDGSAQVPGHRASGVPRRRRKSAALAASVLVVVIASGASLTFGVRWVRLAWANGPSPAAQAVDGAASASKWGVYGVPRRSARAEVEASPRAYEALQTPFVSDSERLKIAALLQTHGPNSALALSRTGGYGVASQRATPQIAREDALRLCNASNRGECGIYEVNGTVLWPRPIPLPPQPWIDTSVARTPFDAARLVGLSDEQRTRVAQFYLESVKARALALGPNGDWETRYDRSSAEEAVRTTLEYCGDRQGAPCRVVAVDDDFVVDDTKGPVDISIAAADRCDSLAGPPFGVGLSNGRVSLADIDASSAIPACRSALAEHPSDPSLLLALGRAMEKNGLLPERALDLYRSAAAGGDAAALDILGAAYEAGTLGLSRDPAAAASYFQKAVEGGNPDAMRRLASMYLAGRGVAQDREHASKLLVQADQAAAAWMPRPR